MAWTRAAKAGKGDDTRRFARAKKGRNREGLAMNCLGSAMTRKGDATDATI